MEVDAGMVLGVGKASRSSILLTLAGENSILTPDVFEMLTLGSCVSGNSNT